VRIESSITAISWIPADSIEGPTRVPFEVGLFHYDTPLPDRLDDLDGLHAGDAFREANELRGWIDVEDGRVALYGQTGRGLLGITRLKFGPKVVRFPAIPLPILRPDPVATETSVTFVQTVGGRMSLPAPRHVDRRPFFQVASSVAWTTLQLTIHADGRAEHRVLGASPFPRHYVYDDSGTLVEKSGFIDFNTWYRDSFGDHTPWGQSDSPALITEVETAVERELSDFVLQGPFRPEHLRLQPGQTLVEQGEAGEDVFLLLDGILAVEVNGEVLAEIGPGAILGERARLEGGRRAATLRAVTPCRVAVVPGDRLPEADLELIAVGHRREVTG
jgi:hypothetical protein